MAQMGFFDLSDPYASLNAKKDPLLEINSVVPWEEFRALLERVWRKPDADRRCCKTLTVGDSLGESMRLDGLARASPQPPLSHNELEIL